MHAPPPPPENTPSVQLAELPMAFAWAPCPAHSFLTISVLVIAGVGPWCVGDAGVHGHWVDPEQVAA